MAVNSISVYCQCSSLGTQHALPEIIAYLSTSTFCCCNCWLNDWLADSIFWLFLFFLNPTISILGFRWKLLVPGKQEYWENPIKFMRGRILHNQFSSVSLTILEQLLGWHSGGRWEAIEEDRWNLASWHVAHLSNIQQVCARHCAKCQLYIDK